MESKFKGTPGLWKCNPKEQFYNGSNNTFEVNHGNDGECVAEVIHGIDNAQLIAAAPDLLEVCLKMQKHMFNNLIAKTPFGLDEAINKALGNGK